jgi:hypothetical protein
MGAPHAGAVLGRQNGERSGGPMGRRPERGRLGVLAGSNGLALAGSLEPRAFGAAGAAARARRMHGGAFGVGQLERSSGVG